MRAQAEDIFPTGDNRVTLLAPLLRYGSYLCRLNWWSPLAKGHLCLPSDFVPLLSTNTKKTKLTNQLSWAINRAPLAPLAPGNQCLCSSPLPTPCQLCRPNWVARLRWKKVWANTCWMEGSLLSCNTFRISRNVTILSHCIGNFCNALCQNMVFPKPLRLRQPFSPLTDPQ